MDQWISALTNGVLDGVVIIAVALANGYLKAHNMRQITAATENTVLNAVNARAGAWVALQAPGWEKAIISHTDQWIVDEAQSILTTMQKANIFTPIELQKMIVGGIGNLQATALSLSGNAPVVQSVVKS